MTPPDSVPDPVPDSAPAATTAPERVVLACRAVTRTYRGPRGPLPVLRGVDLRLERGEIVAVLGPSGSGKSTLLHVLAGLDRPDGGEIRWGELAVHERPPRELAAARARHVGLIFQNHYLLEELSALENVTLPGRIAGAPDAERGLELLRAVGLAERADHRPDQLSGGERQRVAVARALYHRPPLLLADEPTGSLDRTTARSVFEQLLAAAAEVRSAVVLVTHDEALVAPLPRRLVLREGRLEPLP